jgi:hypothetical protein
MDVYARTQIKKSQKKGQSVIFYRKMAFRPHTPAQARQGVSGGRNGGTSIPPRMRVTPQEETMGEDGTTRPALSTQMLMRELESDDDSVTKERVVVWYRDLQEHVRKLMEENKKLRTEVMEMKDSAARNTSDMLGRAQVVHFETDLRTHRRINALVTERIFPVKKFVSGQKELDNFSGNSSLGMLVMAMLKIEKPDQLPWWNAYKDSVADAISNRRTTVTNDLKKVVMSK